MSRSEITNSDDIIDSRDVIVRIAELRETRRELDEAADEANAMLQEAPEEHQKATLNMAMDAQCALEEFDLSDDALELTALEALASAAEGYAKDWSYGATLVRDSYFKEYAQDMAEDIGAVDSSASWPHNCIDWDRAARELRMDYTAVDFDGVTYWVR